MSKRQDLLDEISSLSQQTVVNNKKQPASGGLLLWNTTFFIILRYMLVVPLQGVLLGVYTWIVSNLLVSLVGLFIQLFVSKGWVFLVILGLIFYFLYQFVWSIIEYSLSLLQIVFNFSGIKFSPSINFGKISLLIIGLVCTVFMLYRIWFSADTGLGIIGNIIISYLYLHLVTKGIVLIATVDSYYDSVQECWDQLRKKYGILNNDSKNFLRE